MPEILILGLLFFMAYPAPTIIAMARGHERRVAVFLINLFLGWTIVGWIAALVWAVAGHAGDRLSG